MWSCGEICLRVKFSLSTERDIKESNGPRSFALNNCAEVCGFNQLVSPLLFVMAESFKARLVFAFINIQASSDEWLELLPWDLTEDLPLYCLFQNVLHITLPFISGMNEFENWFRGKLSGQLENGRQGAHSVVLCSGGS